MEFADHDELVLLALLAAIAALTALAPTLRIPYPILLVVGGLALGFIPGVPELRLPPDLVLVGVLPPLLYSAGFFTSLRDLRANVGQISLLAVVAGSFSLADASLRFVLSVIGGIAVGLAVGWLVALVRIRLHNIPAEIAISLLTGYLAYIPATALHVSGVLAAVTVGFYLGWRAPEVSTPAVRMQGTAVWETLVFLVNALLFAIVGLKLRTLHARLSGYPTASLLGYD